MRRVDASPLGRTRNTPVRNRAPESAVVQPNILTHRPHVDQRTLSPNKLNATKKPLISPKLTRKLIQQECVNHPEREAEFRITISGETLVYCERCAAQLASQGFKVERVGTKKKSFASGVGSGISSGSYTKYDGHPRATEIGRFMDSLREVDKCLRENSHQLVNIQNHYSGQIRQLEEFYNSIVCYINFIRNQHVGILREESRKYIQIGLIEHGNNEQNLEDIGCIIHDIQSQMDSIVTEISEDMFRKCLNEYNKNLEMYKHRLEQQNHTMGLVTSIGVDELEVKLGELKRCLGELLGVKEEGFNSNNFSFENMQQTKRKFIGKENRGPFRNLFDDQDSLPCPDESPQFKSR